MSIRHVVTWKLAATDEAERTAHAREMRERLTALVGQIESIRHLEVGINSVYPENNWHVVLVSEFDDVAGLDAYQVHPLHQEIVTFVRSVTAERAAVDYEV
ncbi:Dabb family protein [Mycetocola spongiae]|uniref:Dabb family protein n=1 Tax=Mycetocola spongiae TaxID=2859226 RepID=UPI001CF5F0C4|nr:Dabb family protein [Mycetocola spongiae]UCR87990.1 Dabb family protein [Mycetocola spongiae]